MATLNKPKLQPGLLQRKPKRRLGANNTFGFTSALIVGCCVVVAALIFKESKQLKPLIGAFGEASKNYMVYSRWPSSIEQDNTTTATQEAITEEASDNNLTHVKQKDVEAAWKTDKTISSDEDSDEILLNVLPHSIRTSVVLSVATQASLSAVCRSHNQFDHLQFRYACGAGSTGNMLGHIFLTAMKAFQKNATFELKCSEANTVQALLSNKTGAWFQPLATDTTSTPNLCNACAGHYPHTCPNGLNHAAALIRKALRAVVPVPPEKDDVAIHVRCGDVLKYAHHVEYGYPSYDFYKRILQKDAGSISIITAPWDQDRCRKNQDCDFVDTCRPLILDMQQYLQSTFPNAIVKIHNQDTPVESYGRLMYAKQNVCNPSTFCLYPSLAALGDSFFVASPKLYPFVEKLDLPNIHVMQEPFLNMKDIVGFRKSGDGLVHAITEWLRGGDKASTQIATNTAVIVRPPATKTRP